MTKAKNRETLEWVCYRLVWPTRHHTGISSNAMVVACALGTDVAESNYPRDPSDLNRCIIAAASAPAHHKARAYEILGLFTTAVRERYPDAARTPLDGGRQ